MSELRDQVIVELKEMITSQRATRLAEAEKIRVAAEEDYSRAMKQLDVFQASMTDEQFEEFASVENMLPLMVARI